MGKTSLMLGLLFVLAGLFVACGSEAEETYEPSPTYEAAEPIAEQPPSEEIDYESSPNDEAAESNMEQSLDDIDDIDDDISYEAELPPSTGRIFLYGEMHGCPIHMERQLDIWGDYYHNYDMRHLFIEAAYFTAQFLNMWMQADDDTILYEVFNDWRGSAAHSQYNLDFYKTIKIDFPETIFHGTDVGHQSTTTGARFLNYLRLNGMEDTDTYHRTNENIAQYWSFRRAGWSHAIRSYYKPLNFIREFDMLVDQDVMAIHGGAHVLFGDFGDYTDVPTMATVLHERYGDALQTFEMWLEILEMHEEIRVAGLLQEPLRIDTITVAGIDFEASCFGIDDTVFRNAGGRRIVGREFWRLENAYEHFKDKPLNNDVLPFNNYPMHIEVGQVFIMDIHFDDGTVERNFFRSSGLYWHDLPTTEGFLPYD